MILHTINKPDSSQDLWNQLLSTLGENDSVLLLENAVTCILKDSLMQSVIQTGNVNLYAIKDDLEARGLLGQIPDSVQAIGYTEFVELASVHEKTISWH